MRRNKIEGPPPFSMTLQGGRLSPDNAWDAERLASYSNGSRLSVQITSERNDKLRRKWWAILGQVVKSTGLFPTASKASEIVKEDLALTDSYKRDGKWIMETRSLTDMGEEELLDAVQRMMDYIHDLTGIDMDQWNKETPDQGEGFSNEASAGPSQMPAEQDGAVDPQLPAPSAETPARGGSEKADEETAATRAPASHGREDRAKLVECSKKFMAAAADPDCSPLERKLTLEQAKDAWKGKGYVPDDFLRICYERGLDVVSGRMSAQDATRVLEALIP